MAEDAVDIEEPPGKKKKGKGLLLGLLAGGLCGGGAFFAAFSGLAPAPEPVKRLLDGGADQMTPRDSHSTAAAPLAGDVAFVPLPALIVSLGPSAGARHLQFSAQIETTPAQSDAVAHLSPRILDVFGTYLRAVDEEVLRDPAKMTQLKAQLLRRVRIVAGAENVRRLLITEFVLN